MDIWTKIQDRLRSEVSAPSYEMWFSSSKLVSESDGRIVISVATDFAKDWIHSKYYKLIKSIADNLTKTNTDIVFVVSKEESSTASQPEEVVAESAKNGQFLNPKYTFSTFVIGNSNKFAHAACLASAKNPGKAYNPLFIYGGVGLGKTHLLQAIGHEILAHYPSSDLIYSTTESFTADVVNAIRNNKINEFHNFYRTIKVLLIDDIQFLAGKERTQEELFHTFNALYDVGSQIVITSDRPPKQLRGITDRLISRFEMGLQADIQAPDLETRIAILEEKSIQEHVKIPSEVINYVAGHGFSNIRELEGSLIRLVAIASLQNMDLTLSSAKEVLKDMIPKTTKRISVENIIDSICSYFKLVNDDIIERKRTNDVATPRQIAMYLSRELTDLSLKAIGEKFGGRDHTTIMYACDKISQLRAKDDAVDTAIVDIISKLDS